MQGIELGGSRRIEDNFEFSVDPPAIWIIGLSSPIFCNGILLQRIFLNR